MFQLDQFIVTLFIFSTLTSLIVEAIKKFIPNSTQMATNIIAVITGLVIGCGGSIVFDVLNKSTITSYTIIYAVVTGLATALCAMVGYDKVKQTIEQIASGDKKE